MIIGVALQTIVVGSITWRTSWEEQVIKIIDINLTYLYLNDREHKILQYLSRLTKHRIDLISCS